MLRIRLLNPDEQKDFVKICTKFPVDITLHKGHYAVDAKSILGVMSLDCKFNCYITIGTDNPKVIQEIENALSAYSYE